MPRRRRRSSQGPHRPRPDGEGRRASPRPDDGAAARERARATIERELDHGADLAQAAAAALRVSETCAEAWLLRADAANDANEARRCVREAVAVATIALGRDRLEAERGRLADSPDGTAYLHALHALARSQLADDLAAQAVMTWQHVLVADPRDPAAVRSDLLLLLLALGRDDEADELVAAYADEADAHWAFSRALLRRRRAEDAGGLERATEALDRAIDRFPEAARALVTANADATRGAQIDPLLLGAWDDTESAIDWLSVRLDAAGSRPAATTTTPNDTLDADRRFVAMEHVEEAREAPLARREALARRALDLWPDCAAAWLVLADTAPTPQARVEALRDAVAAARRALRLAADGAPVAVGDGDDARTLLGARDALARALRATDDEEGALAQERALLVEDPDDPLGVGVRLVARCFVLGRDDEAYAQLDARAHEASPGWVWLRVLGARRRGDRVASSFALAEATMVAPFVATLLALGPGRARPPEGLSRDAFAAAAAAAETIHPAFVATPGALAWLASVIPPPPRRVPPPTGPPVTLRRPTAYCRVRLTPELHMTPKSPTTRTAVTRGAIARRACVVLWAATASTFAHAEEAQGPPDAAALTVEVATTVMPDDAVSTPPEKGASVRVMRPTTLIDLTDGVTLGLTPPAGGRGWRGETEISGKRHGLGVVRGANGPCVLVVDRDGDGACDAASERYEAPAIADGQGFRARFPDVALHRGKATVAIEHRAASFSGAFGFPNVRGEAQKPMHPLSFVSEPPEGVGAVEGLTGTVRWALIEADDTRLAIAVAHDGAEGLVVVIGDPTDFATAQRPPMRATPMRRGEQRIGTRFTATDLVIGGTPRTLVIADTIEHTVAVVTTAGVRRGTVDVEGKAHTLYLLDADYDETFAGEDDRWWFGPDGTTDVLNVNNMTEGDAPGLLEGGRVWDLVRVGTDGTTRLQRAHRPQTVHATLHRRAERVNAKRWFPRFAADTEFGRTYPTDPLRPLAPSPAPFHFVLSLDEGLALAKAEGKPLLVDFEADWCVWCKRLDYHSYPDAAVVEALKSFTCVKVNNDLDPTRSFRKLAWQGIPALGFFDAAGKPVRFTHPPARGKPATEVDRISGFLPPADLAAALHAAALASGARIDRSDAGAAEEAAPR